MASEENEVQSQVLEGAVNPHLEIMRSHRERQLKAAIQASVEEQAKAAKQQAKAAAAPAAAAPKPVYLQRGTVSVLENKVWVPRVLVLEDGPVPALNVYPVTAAAASDDALDESTRLLNIPLTGTVDVGHYVDTPSLTGLLTMTMRKAAPRPNAFTLIVNERTYFFEEASEAAKAAWMASIDASAVKTKLKEAPQIADAPAGQLFPTHRSLLSVYERRQWVQRTVELRDGAVPVIAIYEASTAKDAALPPGAVPVAEIKLQGIIDVGDYVEPTDLAARVTATLRKAQPRPNAFTVLVGGKSYHFEAAVPLLKVAWVDKVCAYIVRYRLKERQAAPGALKNLLASQTSYLGVLEKGGKWTARLVVVRDGAVPSICIYDASAKNPPTEDLRVREIELGGFVEVGDFRPPAEATGRLTLRAKAEPRPNAFTVVVNDRMHSFEAPNEDVKRQWVAKLQSFVDKYRLSENEVVPTDPLSSITSFVRRKLATDPKPSGSPTSSSSNVAVSGSPATGDDDEDAPPRMPLKLDSFSDFLNLPPDVLNPLAPEGELGTFQNHLFED